MFVGHPRYARFVRNCRELAVELVTDLARASDSPVEFVTADRVSVWLIDRDAARAYLADLRENPPWFDP